MSELSEKLLARTIATLERLGTTYDVFDESTGEWSEVLGSAVSRTDTMNMSEGYLYVVSTAATESWVLKLDDLRWRVKSVKPIAIGRDVIAMRLDVESGAQ